MHVLNAACTIVYMQTLLGLTGGMTEVLIFTARIVQV